MYKKGLVRLLNVIIIIAIVFLIYMIVYPNYKTIQKENKIADMKTNIYIFTAAVENYAAFNNGKYPLNSGQFKKYVNDGTFPVNPFTLLSMTDDEIIDNVYEDPLGFEDDDPDGLNSKFRGEPGSIIYSVYRSFGDSTLVIHYAFVGLDSEGKPIFYVDTGQKKHIFILHD
ncbi:hypothetical protein KAU34_05570 [candidate division WOR-3 bacterium]|nr:hypothetical protein [candidate division WOR-3 bacterium]